MKTLLSFLLTLCAVSFGSAQNVAYTESFAEIQNPDRGFYHPIYGVASSFTPLTTAQLTNLRNSSSTPWNGNYTISPTIIFRNYVLDIFKSSNLSPAFLNGVQADFDAARAAGVRLLLRFSYTYTAPTGSCGSWICPPYGDAPKSIVLAHIAQLKPYLQRNSDAILAVQNGFIGVWGEQYYTDYFGDASVQGKLTDQNWQDRIEVLRALLDAVPANRMVQVRYPQMKQKFIYGVTAPVTSAAMGAAQANNESDIARIGFHNDCFLSATDDQGTFWDYGTSATFASNQTPALKPYWANDSKYVGVGGETCSDAFSPQNDCAGQAVADMDLLNYSYLNADYNNEVNNDWESGGCMATIKRRLGYRFVLRSGTFPATGTTGGSVSFALKVENVGFAAPFNPRVLKLILRNTGTAQVFSVALTGENADTRFWASGQTVALNKTVTLPAGMPTGSYELLLHLSDASNANTVAARPEYSVQFANTGTWEPATGFNKLNHTISINSVVTNNWSTQLEAESYASMRGVQTEGCAEGGLNVGWIDTGDWMAWNVNIPSAGTYTVEYRIASPNSGRTMQLVQAGGTPVLGSLAVPNTGGWQNWTTVSHRVNLAGGQQQIALDALAGGWNINWLRIKQGAGARSALSTSSRATVGELALYPNPASSELTIRGVEVNTEVAVYDILGKLMLTKKKISSDHPVITIKSLKPGIYLLKIEGQKSRTLRFVKE